MVFLWCKKRVTGVQVYPETISPPLLMDCVALPSPPAPSGKVIQPEKVMWVSVRYRKSRGFADSMAERSFALPGLPSCCKK